MNNRINNFFDKLDLPFCTDYLHKKEVNGYHQVKRSVDLMMTNTFVFNDNWDMEACSTAYTLNPLVWDKQMTDDPEWNYMLNRHSYLQKFVLVSLVENDLAYLVKAKALVLDWVRCQFALSPQSLVSRTMDTGIRCMSWLKVLLYLKRFNLLSDAEEDIILASLKAQLQFLRYHYLDKYSLSNWGIFQTTAMLAWLYYFEAELDLPDLLHFAETELQEQIRLQILEDGSQYEQSTMYHVEVFKALLDLACLVPAYRTKLKSTLGKMAKYLMAMTGPDHCQVAFGDSDVSDTRDILTMAATLLQSPEIKGFAFEALDWETLLLLGREGLESFDGLSREDVSSRSLAFLSSGHIVVRDDRRYLFFKNGSLGSSHSHSDLGSICLYDKGCPLVIDAGRYTYKDETKRYMLKGAESHSTCLVSDIKAEMIRDSWCYERYPVSDYCQLVNQDGYQFIEGVYHVINENGKIYLHTRWIIILPHAITLIVDQITCPGSHELTTQFILDPGVTIENQCVNDLQLISETAFEKRTCDISKRYNELAPTCKLVKNQRFTDYICDYSMFVDRMAQVKKHSLIQTGTAKVLANGLGFEIEGRDYHYTIAVLPEDILEGDKLYQVKSHKLKGKINIFNEKEKIFSRLKN